MVYHSCTEAAASSETSVSSCEITRHRNTGDRNVTLKFTVRLSLLIPKLKKRGCSLPRRSMSSPREIKDLSRKGASLWGMYSCTFPALTFAMAQPLVFVCVVP
jgi:hypothetical protein